MLLQIDNIKFWVKKGSLLNIENDCLITCPFGLTGQATDIKFTSSSMWHILSCLFYEQQFENNRCSSYLYIN